ncbi:MAG: hypothetical protein JWN78_2248 [Bacteroidota bacterium]|nr:hypothetical protein [Bacteroidota bacterium]
MKSHLNTIIISIAIVITACILAGGLKNRNRANNTIAVTGLGKKDFVSDLIVWSGSFTKKNAVLKDAYAAVDQDREVIKQYLLSKGIKSENIVFSAIDIDKTFDEAYDNNGTKIRSVFSGYQLRQKVTIESNDVDRVEELSRKVTELINSGIEFYSDAPEYYYTKLSELKVEMIAAATKDAQTRAKKIAENAGSEVGRLKNADMGVFQIVAQNSSEEYSWGGSFNTSSKRKTATITVKLAYETK